MKRSAKIIALLLAVMIIFGIAAVSVSAEEITLPSPAEQLKPASAKNVLSNYNGTLSLSISSHLGNTTGYVAGVETVKATANGNDYTAIRWKSGGTYPNETSGYFGRTLASSSSKVTDNGLAINGTLLSSYQVIDFDFTVDGYVHKTTVDGTDSYVTYSPEELSAAGLTPDDEGVDRAVIKGDRFYTQVAGWKNKLASTTDGKTTRPLSTSTSLYFLKGEDGVWYYGNANSIAKSKAVVPMADVGEFDHITQVAVPYIRSETVTLDGEEFALVGVRIFTYINGQHFDTFDYAPAGGTSLGLEQLRLTVSGTMKKFDCFSYGIDNYSFNIYELGYESAECYGLDNYFEDYGITTTQDITLCEDIVTSAKYISPNGYMQVKNPSGARNFVSLPNVVKAELLAVENNAVVETNIDLLDIDVPSGVNAFTVKCDPSKVKVTLSEKSVIALCYVLTTEDGYTVKRATEDDLINLEWYDLKGRLYYTEQVAIGAVPFTNTRYFAYMEDGKIYYNDEAVWTWDLGGEIGALDFGRVTAGQTVKMTPSTSDVKVVENPTYVLGNYSENYENFYIAPSQDGTYTAYGDATAEEMLADAAAAVHGNACKLLVDFTGLEGDAPFREAGSGATAITAGKTVYLDLNGHKLATSGIYGSDGSTLFNVNDGVTLNVYSSAEGGAIYFAHVKLKSDRNNQTMAAGGICNVIASAFNCEVNIGALLDSKGNVVYSGDNFAVNGGTILFVNGTETTEDNSGDGERKLNIRGGTYYYAPRGTYSFITLKGHDAKINIDGAKFYGTYSSSSLVHEYLGYSTHGTVVNVKNSYVFTPRVFYRTEFGVYNIENSVIAGDLANTKNGKFNIGAGVVILTGFNSKLSNLVSDGVYYASPKTGDAAYDKFSFDFTHAPLYLAWEPNFDYVLKEGASIEDGVFDDYTEGANIASVSLKESVFTSIVTALSYDVLYVTFTEDELPEGVVPVIWQDIEGETVATSYEFVGNTAKAPIDVSETGVEDTEYSWCISKYEWQNALTEDMTVSEDGCVFIPVETYVPLESLYMMANMSLSDSMVFNLYLITPDGIEEDIEVDGAISFAEEYVPALGGSMFVISVADAIDSFATSTVTVSFTVCGYEISYEITVDVLKYVSAVLGKYECGSDEARLAYQIAEYKAAAAAYTGVEIAEADAARLDAFLAIYDGHESCACAGEYSAELLTEEELNVNFMEAFAGKVSSIAYLINSEYIGIRVDVANGAELVSVTYTSVDGETKSASIKYVEDGYYVVSGISAADARAVMNVTVSLGDDVSVGTYSLGAYTVAMGDDLAKALWSYSLAAYNYKVVLSSEIAD